MLIDKSKIYVAGGINFKDVVLVTDMDVIIDDVVKTFQMKHYWDHRHVNQALIKHFKGQHNSSVVFKKMQELRECKTKEDAQKKIKELQSILTTPKLENKENGVDNPYFDVKGWEYLNKYFLKDLDKLCYWTVEHLNSCWLWTQAIESRNNKDLNIWNGGQTNLGIEEVVVRYSEIDKAEMRQAYLHFMAAEYRTVEKAQITQRKNSSKKFLTALVRDYVGHFNTTSSEVQEMIDNLFPKTSKKSKKLKSNGKQEMEKEGEIPENKIDDSVGRTPRKKLFCKKLTGSKICCKVKRFNNN